jgi:hypothetical protein
MIIFRFASDNRESATREIASRVEEARTAFVISHVVSSISLFYPFYYREGLADAPASRRHVTRGMAANTRNVTI